MTTKLRPAPPPKPSYLSSAVTGTLNSDALRSYIRQQSINTISKRNSQTECTSKPSSTEHSLTAVSTHSEVEAADEADEDDDDDDDRTDGDTIWGTARLRQATPTKPRYGKLASLFNSPDEGSRCTSQATIKYKSTLEYHSSREASEESSSNVATIKAGKKESSPPLPGHARGTVNQESYSSSSMGTERSRQPSILSRLSVFSDSDEGETDECSFPSEQQETPKKKWMHIKDGSTFERAGPKQSKGRRSTKPSASNASSFVFPELIAGPPPLRPSSIVFGDSNSNVDQKDQHQHGQHCNTASSTTGRLARALYSFTGERAYNELSLVPGQSFTIIDEDVGGGWSLALANEGIKEGRGLVPRGWYTYVQDFATHESVPEGHDGAITPFEDQPSLDFTVADEATSSFLAPPSTSAFYSCQSGSSLLRPTHAWRQQEDWKDKSRPASGTGQVYTEPGAAVQALTQMQRSESAPKYITPPASGGSTSQIVTKEDDLEESEASDISLESDFLQASTSATSITEEKSKATPPSLFSSPWKTPVLFGGRTLNRFVPFVTSGAEEYILSGKTQETAHDDAFDVVSGHHGYASWKHPGIVVVTEVHSPEIHTDEAGKEYTAYVVFTSYVLSSDEEMDSADLCIHDPHVRPLEAALTSSVYRRYNQFRWLSSYLGKLFPALMLSMPPFPGTSYGTRFDPLFVQRRRRQLQVWLLQVVRHPILSNEEAVRFFLDSEEEEAEWKASAQTIQQHETDSCDAATMLFSKTKHPLFNVDVLDSEIETSHMTAFGECYQRGLAKPDTGMIASLKAARQSTASTSDSYRQLSYSILRLITGFDPSTAKSDSNGIVPIMQLDNQVPFPPMGNVGRRDPNGATNEERAWCWREGCRECKSMTRSLQCTAEALQSIAASYMSHSNGGLFDLHNRIAMMAKLNSQHKSLLDVHKETLLKFRQATGEADGDQDHVKVVQIDAAMDDIANRCDSVVNVTMSEMDRIHTERCQDWNSLNDHFLDMQIDFYEEILSTLQRAKESQIQRRQKEMNNINASDGPILPSRYEAHLATPHTSAPLLHPDLSSSSASIFNIWK